MSAAAPLRVAVIGARGKLGGFACALLERTPGFELAAGYEREDDWPRALASSGAQLALEATRAGLGFEHAQRLLELGLRVVVATSGVDAAQNAELDRLARERALGGIVVPNFSLGAWLLQRAVEQAALHFDAIEITELHHARKADAPSGTALETARRIAAARRSAGLASLAPANPEPDARGDVRDGVPIHSVRMPGLYAHQEVLLGRAGETLTLRHDMSGPEAFGPGLLLALRYASTARGVARGLDAALACAPPRDD